MGDWTFSCQIITLSSLIVWIPVSFKHLEIKIWNKKTIREFSAPTYTIAINCVITYQNY